MEGMEAFKSKAHLFDLMCLMQILDVKTGLTLSDYYPISDRIMARIIRYPESGRYRLSVSDAIRYPSNINVRLSVIRFLWLH